MNNSGIRLEEVFCKKCNYPILGIVMFDGIVRGTCGKCRASYEEESKEEY